jgi:predicted AAA+ superfamily ATPase
MAAELGASFAIDSALELGTIPLVVASEHPRDTLDAYITLYLREEVQAEGMVRNIGGFSRFLESMSFSHGAVLNTSEVARECQIGRKTVEGYISILVDLLLSFELRVFSRRAKRRITSHPKFYYFDTGVFRSLRPKGPLDSPEEIHGAALEGLVAQHLRAWIAYRGGGNELSFWRTKSGNEVDFIVYGEDGLSAIEVKNSSSIRPRDLNGLIAFRDDYPETQLVLLYRGRERLKRKGVVCIPCDEFLLQLKPARPLPVF